MTLCKIIATYTITHRSIMRMVVMTCTIRANWVMIVVPIAVIPIEERIYAIEWMPPTWPITPVVRRMPAYP